MTWVEIVALCFSLIFFIVGLFGVILPVLPGIALVYLGILLYALAEGFEVFSPLLLIVLGLIAVMATALDYMAGVYGARKFGASAWGLWGAVAGLVVGFFFGPLGMLAGPLVGALIGEILGGRETRQAAKAGLGTVVGSVGGMVVKLAICLVLIAVFLFKLACG